MADNKCQNLISPQAADKLIAAHDGDLTLLYLHICRSGSLDLDKAANALCRTMRELEAAEEKLRRMGLLDAVEAPPHKGEKLPPPTEIPQYTAKEVADRAQADGQFSVIISEAAKVMGHSLSGNDMKSLFGIYDYLKLPTEVILVMLNYCGELFREKYGDSRRPSIKAIEKEAYTWERQEIFSLEQAEQYIIKQKNLHSGIGRIQSLLGIHGRAISAAERKAFENWLDMGFDDDALSLAYDKTAAHTGGFRLNYMNRILENWHLAGLHTLGEIDEKEGRRSPAAVTEQSGKSLDKSIIDLI